MEGRAPDGFFVAQELGHNGITVAIPKLGDAIRMSGQ
jgi:hypothetical protein